MICDIVDKHCTLVSITVICNCLYYFHITLQVHIIDGCSMSYFRYPEQGQMLDYLWSFYNNVDL